MKGNSTDMKRKGKEMQREGNVNGMTRKKFGKRNRRNNKYKRT